MLYVINASFFSKIDSVQCNVALRITDAFRDLLGEKNLPEIVARTSISQTFDEAF